jgi:hypothetical protein
MCRVIILVLQNSCTIYYGLWPPDNINCSVSNMVLESKLGFSHARNFRAVIFFFLRLVATPTDWSPPWLRCFSSSLLAIALSALCWFWLLVPRSDRSNRQIEHQFCPRLRRLNSTDCPSSTMSTVQVASALQIAVALQVVRQIMPACRWHGQPSASLVPGMPVCAAGILHVSWLAASWCTRAVALLLRRVVQLLFVLAPLACSCSILSSDLC